MRRAVAVLAGLATVLAGCGGDDAADDSVPEVSLVLASAPDSVPVPSVDLPDETPTSLVVTEITPGAGPEATAGDIVMVDYVGVRSEDGARFDTSFGRSPYPVQIGNGDVIRGWDEGLVGVRAGERVQLDIPSELAYGDQPRGEVIKAGDALTFLIDVLAVIPPNDPAEEPTAEQIPTSPEPAAELKTEDVTVGEGATADIGMTVFVNYVQARADNGVVLTDTWTPDEAAPEQPTLPKQMILIQGSEIPGFIDGVVGMRVGGRRIITVPFEQAFGEDGRPVMGLPARTDVVVVVDLVGAY